MMPPDSGDSGDAQLLGLPPNPSQADVKKAWRAFALQWHPDVHPAGPERVLAEERFKKAQGAHERLLRASTAPHTGEFYAATENTNASYVRRRRPAAASAPIFGYGSLGYDQNAGSKIAIGLAVFGLFCFWASNAWSRQTTESRRKQQALSTVSYGAHAPRAPRLSLAPARDRGILNLTIDGRRSHSSRGGLCASRPQESSTPFGTRQADADDAPARTFSSPAPAWSVRASASAWALSLCSELLWA